MKKFKLFISLWFTMFSIVVFGQAEYEKIAITQNTQDNTAGRLLVQDVTTGEVRWILKSILDNKFNQPTGNATQYLDGAGTPTTFPTLGQSDRVITEVRNSTGATVTKGTVVYLNGATGGKPNIQKAQANAESTSSGTFGVIQSDINNNSNGYVVVIGTVVGLNTSAFTAGQILWLSPTVAGGFTTTKPVAPNNTVYVAIITLAATQGAIEVKIQNGYELDEIHDVLITSKTDNDGLIYESASGLWKNKQITKAMVGLANVDNTSDLNKPISTATQTALNLKENTANKNTANGYAGLGSDGKLISSQLPAITITDTFVVGSQAAMLALTAETGDVAVRTDVNKSFILKGTSAGTLADWQELLTPTSSITSVFGRQGAVTANNGDYTTALVTETTNKKYQTDNQASYNDATSSIQTQLNSKANDNAVVHLAGSESVTGAKTFTATPSFDNNVFLKHLSGWSNPAGYTVIGGRTNGFLLSASSTKTALIGLGNLTQAWTYDFPNKSGTFAMTSDVPTISGTSNYVTKFATASTLGNSLIFDNGTNIGFGTTSPTEIVHLRSSQPVIRFEKAGVLNWRAGVISGNTFTINVDSGVADPFNITTGGYVGFGTPTPLAKSHVVGGLITTSISNISTTLNSRFDLANPAISLGIGYLSSDQPFLQAFNNTSSIATTLNFNPFGGTAVFGGAATFASSVTATNGIFSGNIKAGSYAFNNSVNGTSITSSSDGEHILLKPSSNVKLISLLSGLETINFDARLGAATFASSVTAGDGLRIGVGNSTAVYKFLQSSDNALFSLQYLPNGIVPFSIPFSISYLGAATFASSVSAKNIQVAGASGGYTTGDNPMIGFGNAPATNSFGTIEHPFGDKMIFNDYHGYNFKVANGGSTPVEAFRIDTNRAATFSSSVTARAFNLTGQTGSSTSPLSLSFANDYSNGTTANKSKIFLYNDGGIDIYGLATGAFSDFQYHSGGTGNTASSHVFYNGNIERFRIANNGAATFSSSVTATGFFQSSDSRLKDIISRDGDVIKYKWKDKRDDKIHIGYVAQEVQKENPDQVNADDKGILSVNYIEILVQKIKDLENRIKQLEK